MPPDRSKGSLDPIQWLSMREVPNPTKREKRRTLLKALWKAQGKHCPTCGVMMLPVHWLHPRRGWSIEHVYPQGRYRHYATPGNRLVTHIECNNTKADREPTGCEVITLLAANARLGIELTEKPLILTDVVVGSTALSLAFQRAMGIDTTVKLD